MQRMEYSEISEIICKEKIYTDCSDYDNFKKSVTAMNRVLDAHGVRLVVLEDFVYCDCEYTVLSMDEALADRCFLPGAAIILKFTCEEVCIF